MAWKARIPVHNSSNMDKWSPVEIGWADLKKTLEQQLENAAITPTDPESYVLELRDENENKLNYQIDKVYLDSTFVFNGQVSKHSVRDYFLHGLHPGEAMHNTIVYPSLELNEFLRQTQDVEREDERRPVIYPEKGLEDFLIRNFCLRVSFHLKKNTIGRRAQSSGCASFMGVENSPFLPYDVLDPYNRGVEKKAMQIEEVEFFPRWANHSLKIRPCDIDYEVYSVTNGPIRSSLIVKVPFVLEYKGRYSTNQGETKNIYNCNFYRCLILDREKHYIMENIFALAEELEIIQPDGKKQMTTPNELIPFKARFDLIADFGFGIRSFQASTKDWFAIGNDRPESGWATTEAVAYGFACNCGEELEPVKIRKSTWTLKCTNFVHCLHKALCEKNTHQEKVFSEPWTKYYFDNNIGDEWFDAIYTKLWCSPDEIEIV